MKHLAPLLLRCLPRFAALLLASATAPAGELERLEYRRPELAVDLGVGLWAWPLPLDFDRDGDLDLVVSCPDVPSNGTYLFENPDGDVPLPVFKPARRIGPGHANLQVSPLGDDRVLLPGRELTDFRDKLFSEPVEISLPARVHPEGRKTRANQWRYADWERDGDLDIVVGIGDWTEYGWDDAFDSDGRWTRGPLHGYVYLIENRGIAGRADYEPAVRIEAGGRPIDTYGMPSPNLADFDGDGDLDILCGEFLDRLIYFENIGTREEPRYAAGRFLRDEDGLLRMDLQMIVPVALDWDRDGDADLVVGQEDGRVAFVENTGKVRDSLPLFRAPRFFRQEADCVKFGALVTPFAVDWDDDGDEDLICGNTAGYIGFLENLDGGDPPSWNPPVYVEADGEVIRIQAGENGSIQGPCEAKWGYTTLSVRDWDEDGRRDLVVNSIWGRVVWYRNVGSRGSPELTAARPVEVEWPDTPPAPAWNWWRPEGKELVTQWRTTPFAVDFTRDGLTDLVMLDHEGYLSLFRRRRRGDTLELLPGARIFVDEEGEPLLLARGPAGKSGRRKIAVVDWDGDGHLDVLLSDRNARLLRGEPRPGGKYVLRDEGPLADRRLAGHTTSPAVVDWNRDGVPDLLIGAEDGFLYYLRR